MNVTIADFSLRWCPPSKLYYAEAWSPTSRPINKSFVISKNIFLRVGWSETKPWLVKNSNHTTTMQKWFKDFVCWPFSSISALVVASLNSSPPIFLWPAAYIYILVIVLRTTQHCENLLVNNKKILRCAAPLKLCAANAATKIAVRCTYNLFEFYDSHTSLNRCSAPQSL